MPEERARALEWVPKNNSKLNLTLLHSVNINANLYSYAIVISDVGKKRILFILSHKFAGELNMRISKKLLG